jgi:hypothetical protein
MSNALYRAHRLLIAWGRGSEDEGEESNDSE